MFVTILLQPGVVIGLPPIFLAKLDDCHISRISGLKSFDVEAFLDDDIVLGHQLTGAVRGENLELIVPPCALAIRTSDIRAILEGDYAHVFERCIAGGGGEAEMAIPPGVVIQ